jgi:hypothetical protein
MKRGAGRPQDKIDITSLQAARSDGGAALIRTSHPFT